MASKSIIAEMIKGDKKLNGDKYHVWHLKMQYVLEEQELIESINHVMNEPEEGNTAQHRRDLEVYKAWKKKDSIAKGILISAMEDDLMIEYEQYPTAHEVWVALREKFGGITASKLRQLTIKFDNYKNRSNHTMAHHLREMSSMI